MFTLEEILIATKGQLIQPAKGGVIRGITTDTRVIQKNHLFVALKGPHFDGHDFLSQAQDKGASVVLVQKRNLSFPKNVAVIWVPDTLKAYGQIALFHRRRFPGLKVIAITGSVGKTSTKEMLYRVLRNKYRVHHTQGTLNNQIGVPLTLLQIRPFHDVAIIEVGTSFPGEIQYLASLIEPTIVVLTHIGASHLAGLHSLQGVYQEKKRLAENLSSQGVLVFNGDDPFLKNIKKWKKPFTKTSYGLKARHDIVASKIHIHEKGIDFFVNQYPFVLKKPVMGHIYNALASIAVGRLLSVPGRDIQKAVASFTSPQGRLVFYRYQKITVIDDTYNANPLSFQNAIQTLRYLSSASHRSFLVASDMLELGALAKKCHFDMGVFAAQNQIDYVLTYGKMAYHIHRGVVQAKPRTHAEFFQTKENLLKYLRQTLSPGDRVLIKGSRGMKMEDILKGIMNFQKG